MTLLAKDIDRLDDQRACEETLATARALSDAAPADLDLLRDLSAAYSDLGDILRERGAADAAIGMFEQHLAIARSVSERVPDDLDAMNELCAAYERVADVAREQGDLTQSLEMAQRSLDLSRELVERAGDEPRFQRGLAIACEKVANVLGKRRLATCATRPTRRCRAGDGVDPGRGRIFARSAFSCAWNVLLVPLFQALVAG